MANPCLLQLRLEPIFDCGGGPSIHTGDFKAYTVFQIVDRLPSRRNIVVSSRSRFGAVNGDKTAR